MPIEPDSTALLAVERIINGANAHEGRGLMDIYKSWCWLGDTEKAAQAKWEMLRFAVKWSKISSWGKDAYERRKTA